MLDNDNILTDYANIKPEKFHKKFYKKCIYAWSKPESVKLCQNYARIMPDRLK